MTWRSLAAGSLLGIACICAIAGGAEAALAIKDNGAPQDVVDDKGGNVLPAGLPLNLTGFNSSNAISVPVLMVVDAGYYKFSYMGSGNAGNHNTFSIGGHSFDDKTSTYGDAFTLYLPAGPVDFAFLADMTHEPVLLANGHSTPRATYFVAVGMSANCTRPKISPTYSCNNLGPPETGPRPRAWIGLSDMAFPTAPTGPYSHGDHDYQDLGVLVEEVRP